MPLTNQAAAEGYAVSTLLSALGREPNVRRWRLDFSFRCKAADATCKQNARTRPLDSRIDLT
jgi:hypothetical protein